MMKNLDLYIHGGLLIVALGLAYGAWKADPPEERREFSIFDPGPQGAREIKWEDERTVATMTITGEGDMLETWIVHGRRRLLPKKEEPMPKVEPKEVPPSRSDAGQASGTPDGGTAADAAATDTAAVASKPDAPAKEEVKPETPASAPDAVAEITEKYGDPELRAFPGSKAAKELAEGLRPLKALRQFDDLEADALEAMGIHPLAEQVEVVGHQDQLGDGRHENQPVPEGPGLFPVVEEPLAAASVDGVVLHGGGLCTVRARVVFPPHGRDSFGVNRIVAVGCSGSIARIVEAGVEVRRFFDASSTPQCARDVFTAPPGTH